MRRVPFDTPAYLRHARARCFVCALLAGEPGYEHHVVHRDDVAVVFLSRYPSEWGHVLVAPVSHVEHIVSDVDEQAYVAFQRVVHRAGRALTSVVENERLYVLSLGSRQGNAHVHVHLVPCPPGLPYEEQQLALLAISRGYVSATDEEMAALAASLAAAY